MRWACVFLLACSPASTPVLAVGPAAAAKTAVPAPETDHVKSSGVACTFKTASFHVQPQTALCSFGACFAELEEIVEAESVLRLPVGRTTTIALELETGALRLRGSIRSDDLVVAPKTATAIDGWITPIALGSVGLRAGLEGGDVEIEVKDSPELELALPVVTARRCFEIGFEEPEDTDDVLEPLVVGARTTSRCSPASVEGSFAWATSSPKKRST